MIFLPRVLLVFCMACLSAGQARADEIMLKIASVASGAVSELTNRPASGTSALVPASIREAPAALQALYPEQGRIIGRRMPDGTNPWHAFIIDFSSTARVVFFEVGVNAAVLGSLASGAGSAALQDRIIQQYTHGSTPDAGEVFTAGYSLFTQELMQINAREWLERVMPLRNGIGIIALRRSGAETRTDTLLIRIDPRHLPRGVSGMPEAIIAAGWDR